jgi:signal transduction histidine kinase
MKYSEANHINVDFSVENKTLKFKITDDGKGFDLKTVELGNGIANMKKRAQDIGARIDIASKEKKGTTILLHIDNL